MSNSYAVTPKAEEFVLEQMTYATLEARCAARNEVVCDDQYLSPVVGFKSTYATGHLHLWTKEPCSVQIQVHPSGWVNIVETAPAGGEVDDSFALNSFGEAFRIRWDSDAWPKHADGCVVTACDWGAYLSRYSDLAAAFGTDHAAAANHYNTAGAAEGRDCTSTTAPTAPPTYMGEGCTQTAGKTCLCTITVEALPAFTDPTRVPTIDELHRRVVRGISLASEH
jgi:hypothetical protein